MKLVIIESPYAGDVWRNVTYARRCLRDSLARGEAPIASHLLYTQAGVLDDSLPIERALGIEAGLSWGRVAEMAAFYVDLGWSNGMTAARERHSANRLPFEERTIGEREDDGFEPCLDCLGDYCVMNCSSAPYHRRVRWP